MEHLILLEPQTWYGKGMSFQREDLDCFPGREDKVAKKSKIPRILSVSHLAIPRHLLLVTVPVLSQWLTLES